MNPVIVIPSYWDADDSPRALGERGIYDHTTPIDRPVPELETCLASLDKVRGVMRVIVLLVAPAAHERAARARVEGVCRQHPRLNILLVGSPEAGLVSRAVLSVGRGVGSEAAALRGYGAIRNTGLLVACTLGHDVVVFMDDDEVAESPDFLIDAVYGLGMRSHANTKIVAKTGYFINREGSPYASDHVAWCDRAWSKHEGFNAWMRKALDEKGPRITRSNVCCGGCMALHAEAFTTVPFDPWITRGEDLDYLINLRLCGIDMWFDSGWSVRHLPPPTPSIPSRFMQDAYRWTYEAAKLAHANTLIETTKVAPESLDPYPGPWLRPNVGERIARTALRRATASRDRLDYLRIMRRGRASAEDYAAEHVTGYAPLMAAWRRVAATLWEDEELAGGLVELGAPRAPEPGKTSSWMELSGGNLGGDL